MKMTNDDLMAYVDGTLSPAARVRVEAQLASSPEDAALAFDMKEARAALLEWHEAEPVAVSPDFWPRLRDKLPADGPRRSPARRAAANLGAWLWPSQSPAALSLRVAAIAILLALGAMMFLPRHDAPPAMATSGVQAMKRANQQHRAFTNAPDAGAPLEGTGDTRSNPSGDTEDPDARTP